MELQDHLHQLAKEVSEINVKIDRIYNMIRPLIEEHYGNR